MLHIKQSRLVNRYGENDQSTTDKNEILNKVSPYQNTDLCSGFKVCQENSVNRRNNNN